MEPLDINSESRSQTEREAQDVVAGDSRRGMLVFRGAGGAGSGRGSRGRRKRTLD